jgi:hypothetical protein
MPSGPSTKSTDKPRNPAHPSAKTTRKAAPPGSSKPAKDNVPDANAAEPVPHEHLPSRSDDN